MWERNFIGLKRPGHVTLATSVRVTTYREKSA